MSTGPPEDADQDKQQKRADAPPQWVRLTLDIIPIQDRHKTDEPENPENNLHRHDKILSYRFRLRALLVRVVFRFTVRRISSTLTPFFLTKRTFSAEIHLPSFGILKPFDFSGPTVV
jgi:hypothetical protein